MKPPKNIGKIELKGISISQEQNVKIQLDVGSTLEDSTMYRKIVGRLIYFAITRPYLKLCGRTSESFHVELSKAPHRLYEEDLEPCYIMSTNTNYVGNPNIH